MFDSIAGKYDITNGILSCQLHRLWNNKLAAALPAMHKGAMLTDLCCGTGDIAFRWLQKNRKQSPRATLVDFSEQMLACAKLKGEKLPLPEANALAYIKADVQELPLQDASTDYVSMAYGIRNVKQPKECFKEIFRILKPGGTFAILELTRPKGRILASTHNFYLKTLLPLLGKWMTTNKEAYTYLGSSIGEFIDPTAIAEELKNEHFTNISIKSISFGIVTLIVAQKP